MTIKEVEQRLEIPRATVRFYEKEGLFSPTRSENGYREYSEEDVVLLKKIIIFRKLGFAVSDIEDVLDGAKPMSEALENNIENLTRQMQELQGAMMLCRKMQENGEQIETFDAEKYWNAVEEEEKKGNRFLDIAKDVVRFEKATVLEFFSITHDDGKPTDAIWKVLIKIVVTTLGFCFGWCLLEAVFGELSIETFRKALSTFVGMLVIEIVVALPTFFYLKKHPKAKKKNVELWMVLGILVILVVGLVVVKLVK